MTHEATGAGENSRQAVEQYLALRMQWMGDAVELVTGSRETDPAEVFAQGYIVRTEGEGVLLSDEQEVGLREVAGRFGIGGEIDVVSGADYDYNEAGLPWKFDSEIRLPTRAKMRMMAGSPDRIIGPKEIEYMEAKLNGSKADGEERVEVATTEYGMIRQLAELEDGFVPLEEDEILPYGYDINNGNAVSTEPTGQFTKIGKCNGVPSVMVRIDRNNTFDEAGDPVLDDKGNQKFTDRPDSADMLGVISDILTMSGDETSSVGINSSTTYASRAIDTIRAGLKRGREFVVGLYGRQTLADVRGLPVAEPSEIHQIPGELRITYDKLMQLQAEL